MLKLPILFVVSNHMHGTNDSYQIEGTTWGSEPIHIILL